jgi:hypothetical protein
MYSVIADEIPGSSVSWKHLLKFFSSEQSLEMVLRY